jgi:hypothetical protein
MVLDRLAIRPTSGGDTAVEVFQRLVREMDMEGRDSVAAWCGCKQMGWQKRTCASDCDAERSGSEKRPAIMIDFFDNFRMHGHLLCVRVGCTFVLSKTYGRRRMKARYALLDVVRNQDRSTLTTRAAGASPVLGHVLYLRVVAQGEQVD